MALGQETQEGSGLSERGFELELVLWRKGGG